MSKEPWNFIQIYPWVLVLLPVQINKEKCTQSHNFLHVWRQKKSNEIQYNLLWQYHLCTIYNISKITPICHIGSTRGMIWHSAINRPTPKIKIHNIYFINHILPFLLPLLLLTTITITIVLLSLLHAYWKKYI